MVMAVGFPVDFITSTTHSASSAYSKYCGERGEKGKHYHKISVLHYKYQAVVGRKANSAKLL